MLNFRCCWTTATNSGRHSLHPVCERRDGQHDSATMREPDRRADGRAGKEPKGIMIDLNCFSGSIQSHNKMIANTILTSQIDVDEFWFLYIWIHSISKSTQINRNFNIDRRKTATTTTSKPIKTVEFEQLSRLLPLYCFECFQVSSNCRIDKWKTGKR